MKTLLLFVSLISSSFVFGHSGGTDSSGCHNDHIRGGYHCHKSDSETPKTLVRSPSSLENTKIKKTKNFKTQKQ